MVFNLIGSVISLCGGIILLLNKKFAHNASHYLSSFAAGTLLGAAFFDLLPEALEESEHIGITSLQLFVWVLVGALFFFLVERFLHWSHHHGYEDHEIQGKPTVPLVVIGDTIHNFIDGVAIAATFTLSIPLGIVTTFAVGAHEIPQEIGDFGIMLKKGIGRKKIILINILSALASFVGALLAFYFAEQVEGLTAILLAITAGFFLYIALSDLVPEIHHENKKGLALWETIFLIGGVVVIYFAIAFLEQTLGGHGH